MTDRFTIALAQISQSVGDLAGNAAAMIAARNRAAAADLIVYPELQLVGYPPEDLVLKPAFLEAAARQLDALAEQTKDSGPAMLVGTVVKRKGQIFNAVALLDGGRVAAMTLKHELPNYGTFDEKRWFEAGPLPQPLKVRGVSIGLAICEDIWRPQVAAHLAGVGAEILIVPNASPFEVSKKVQRLELARKRIAETGLPVVYLNRTGGQDELVFDGYSFVLNADGQQVVRLPGWQEAHVVTHWHRTEAGWQCDKPVSSETEALEMPLSGTSSGLLSRSGDGEEHPEDDLEDIYPEDDLEDIYNAMVMGLRDYVDRNGFPGVVLGLSGGIDSALSAAVAVDALGADRVWTVMLPSRFTGQESLDDAAECARLLGVRLDTVAIEPAVGALDLMLGPVFSGRVRDITEENVQSRLRGVTLMALSNKFGHMLLTTGNKSEMAVGYATIYGDMAGGYSVLKDIYKTTVFALSRWRNRNRPAGASGPEGPVMPENVISKPPTAELREGQRDDDTLPPYDVLDAILSGLIEDELSVADIVARGYDPATVQRIERLLYIAEYKRRQAPPGVKVSRRNFGRDRRYPITHRFRTA